MYYKGIAPVRVRTEDLSRPLSFASAGAGRVIVSGQGASPVACPYLGGLSVAVCARKTGNLQGSTARYV